jgi:endo-1,4-beta-xylanase
MKLMVLACTLFALLSAVVVPAMAATPDAMPLWPKGVPGPKWDGKPEAVRMTDQGDHVWSHITTPTLTPYLPAPGTATGAAVIVIPGGGHKEIWIDHEGYRVAEWLSQHGVAAFVLKYRLSKEDGSPFGLETDTLSDAQRAIREVRHNAKAWGIDPNRVGAIGFSAGGNLAALAGWRGPVPVAAPDAVDAENAKPDFIGLVYPGQTDATFTADMPPAFLLGGEKDQVSDWLPSLYLSLKQAKVPVEIHMLSGVGHGFGIRATNPAHVAVWPSLFYNWMDAEGFLKPKAAAKP